MFTEWPEEVDWSEERDLQPGREIGRGLAPQSFGMAMKPRVCRRGESRISDAVCFVRNVRVAV